MRYLINTVREHNSTLDDIIYRLNAIVTQTVGYLEKTTTSPPAASPIDDTKVPMVGQLDAQLSAARMRTDNLQMLLANLEDGLGIDKVMSAAKSVGSER